MKDSKEGRRMVLEKRFPTSRGEIKLKISAYPRDWFNLGHLTPEAQLEILRKFTRSAFEDSRIRSIYEILPRGPFAKDVGFTKRIKSLASYTYYLVRDMLKDPTEERKKFISHLIREFKEETKLLTSKGKERKPSALELTAFIMEWFFGKERDKRSLIKWTDSSEKFRKTYIDLKKFRSGFYKTRLNSVVRSIDYYVQLASEEDPLEAFRLLFFDFLEDTPFQNLVGPLK